VEKKVICPKKAKALLHGGNELLQVLYGSGEAGDTSG